MDESKLTFPIRLGDSKSKLLKQGLIQKHQSLEDAQAYYTGINGSPWRINFMDDEVHQIWYNNKRPVLIDHIDISQCMSPKVDLIIQNLFGKPIAGKPNFGHPYLGIFFRDDFFQLLTLMIYKK